MRKLKSSQSAVWRCSTERGNELGPRGRERRGQKPQSITAAGNAAKCSCFSHLGLGWSPAAWLPPFPRVSGGYGKYSAQVAPSSCRAAVYVCTDGSADLHATLASAFRGAYVKKAPGQPWAVLHPPNLRAGIHAMKTMSLLFLFSSASCSSCLVLVPANVIQA